MTEHAENGSQPIGVIGAGAWGTALAQMLASDGRDVLIWARENDVVNDINGNHINSVFLPSSPLSNSLRATGDLADLAACSTVLAVPPAQHLRSVLGQLSHNPTDLVLCSKGIEAETGLLMNSVATDLMPDSDIAVLSGPTFAHEVAAGLPTAVTLACHGGQEQWERLSPVIAKPHFRTYFTDDVVGAEIGGAIKNVLAIASGVVEGLSLGQNARSALIARGYAEMQRFGEAMGARRETLAGLSGLGDLVLTCSSTSSRNFSFGKALGMGKPSCELMANRTTVAEGAHTAPILLALTKKLHVSMPIVTAVNHLLDGSDAQKVVAELLIRPLKAE